jgi:hypothetical protein
MRLRPGRVPLLLAALAPASLVLSHDLSFLAVYGPEYRAVLLATGHDGRWSSTVSIVVAISALLAAAALGRLAVLWWQARGLEATFPALSGRPLLGRVASFWPRLLLLTALLFLAQENAEHLAQGAGPAGLGPLFARGPVQPFEIVALVSLIASMVAALFLWTHAALIAGIRAALSRRHRAGRPPVAATPIRYDRPRGPLIALHLGRRAPPLHAPVT